jgi:lipoate-protein ligase A
VVERHEGRAAELHARPWPTPLTRTVWFLAAQAPAVVLGSAQPALDVDAAAAAADGIDVARRASGGGAVLLVPGHHLWVDVFVPRGDPLWRDDVAEAMYWVGDLWALALGGLGTAAAAHRGPILRTEWSSCVCFSGIGPGEVLDAEGRKVVGVSQRRTRAGARFQCVVHADLDAVLLDRLVHVPAEALEIATATSVSLDALGAALVDRLPA